MKPSEQIKQKMLEFLDQSPDIKEKIVGSKYDPESVAVASAVMIQAILDWLDENFKPSV